MTKAEYDMLALIVKAVDDVMYGLERGNTYEDWNRVSTTWAEVSNPIRERLRADQVANILTGESDRDD